MELEVLKREEWHARAAAHAARVDVFIEPHLARRADRVKHPVHDFLFTYYSQRPAQLRRWHPGFGVGLADAPEYDDLKGYSRAPVVEEVALQPSRDPVTVSASYAVAQRSLVERLHRLLSATAERTPQFGCFGLHEWAMVYRQSPEQLRHNAWPLRLGSTGTDEVVESHRVACSHFDAFRFFTEPARGLNVLQPSRDDRASYEQPGCLHAGMDLYKHAFRLSPMVPSELVADCFELARDIRVLDMRAAPYDLADLGFDPIRIETPEGKAEYVEAQRGFAARGAPLRAALVEWCELLLAVGVDPAVTRPA